MIQSKAELNLNVFFQVKETRTQKAISCNIEYLYNIPERQTHRNRKSQWLPRVGGAECGLMTMGSYVQRRFQALDTSFQVTVQIQGNIFHKV